MSNFKVVGAKGNVIGYVIEKMGIGINKGIIKSLVKQYNITTTNILKNVIANEYGNFANVRVTKPRK